MHKSCLDLVEAGFFCAEPFKANYEDLSKGMHKTKKYLFRFLLNLLHNESHLLKNRELHIQYIDTLNTKNDLVKLVNDPANDPVKASILQQLQQKPNANYNELAEKTGYSTATIKREIKNLKEQGIIECIGSDKTGFWRIIKNKSNTKQFLQDTLGNIG